MNPNQLCTEAEAQAIAAKLSAIGGGVEKIYVPTFSVFPAPTDGAGAQQFVFRFANGADGFNAGLIRQTMRYFPTRWPVMLATEVENSHRETMPWEEN